MRELFILVNMSVTYLNAFFRVFPDAEACFIFRWTQQVQYIFIIDLQSKRKKACSNYLKKKVSAENQGTQYISK